MGSQTLRCQTSMSAGLLVIRAGWRRDSIREQMVTPIECSTVRIELVKIVCSSVATSHQAIPIRSFDDWQIVAGPSHQTRDLSSRPKRQRPTVRQSRPQSKPREPLSVWRGMVLGRQCSSRSVADRAPSEVYRTVGSDQSYALCRVLRNEHPRVAGG
jgi:hypothetical protein